MTPYHRHPFGASERPPHIERVEVTRVTFLRGTGCCEESPVREVTAYYDDDGACLVQMDPTRDRGQ